MNSRNWIAAILAGAMVSGCMKIEDYPQKTKPEVVRFSSQNGFQASRMLASKQVVVRTFVKTGADGKGLKEVGDAACSVTSPELRAALRTPAQMPSPKIKGQPGVLSVSCTRGDLKGARSFQPAQPHKSTLVSGSGSGGAFAAGLLITVVANAASKEAARKRDEWQYFEPDMEELRIHLQ